MDEINVCCLEDSSSVMPVFDHLTTVEGYKLNITDDYRDLADWISEDRDFYDIYILDLKVPSYSLQSMPHFKNYDKGEHFSPTLYFMDNYLINEILGFENKVIIISAYFNDYVGNKNFTAKLHRYRKVDKNDPEFMIKLKSHMNSIIKSRKER